MDILRKARKPGRSVFFQEEDQEQPEGAKEETGISSDIEDQLKLLLNALKAVKHGDFTIRLPIAANGVMGEIAKAFNEVVVFNENTTNEVTRVTRVAGEEGKLSDTTSRATVAGATGSWKNITDTVNYLLDCIAMPLTEIGRVVTSISQGDLTQKMPASWRNEIAIARGDTTQKMEIRAAGDIKVMINTINEMVDNLNTFSGEVTRVAREVGAEGKLGGQAEVKGVGGTWKDLTDNVNMLAGNLTSQVRNIADVTTAVASGDLSQKITVEALGEILALKDTINGMVDNLSAITGNINNVMALVGEGTLMKLIDVEASGEYASMVNGINSTIESLRGIVRELTEAGINVGKVSQNMLSAGQEMNSMVTQMSSSVDQIAKGANVQAQQISAASKESEEVGKTASNTLVRSEEMNKMSEVANNAAQEGSKAMVETVKNTELMLAGSKESVERIVSLSKSSEQIQEIVDVIRDIATQTNILAINAAIEAVRAGKQGKGFAVVAEEVKTLSADSKSQAKKISSLVQSVLKETQETTDTIKVMAGNVEMGRRSIDQTSKAFSDINNAVVSTSTTAKEISLAASEQKKSIDSISQSLDKISGIATDTSTGSVQSAEGVKRLIAKMQELTTTAATLTDMSEKLQQTVGRFNVGEEAVVKQSLVNPKRTARKA